MEFSNKDVDATFQPVMLCVTITSYEELHRVANSVGVVDAEVMKGLREQAKKAIRARQKEEPEVVKKSALRETFKPPMREREDHP